MKELTVLIPRGYQLSFTTDDFTSGTYVRLGNPGGTRYTPAAIAVSTNYNVGPFNDDRNYQFYYVGTDLSFTQTYSGVFDSTDETNIARLELLTGTQALSIADITDTATGAEIETAVNSIIAALVGAGIVAEAEE